MNKRRVGESYESRAAEYLMQNGYRIIAANFRNRFGEIDLIAEEDSVSEWGEIVQVLVFVEVKYRRTTASGLPEEAVSVKKQQIICRVADFFRARYQITDNVSCRFDVIAVEGDDVRHYKNAFPYRR